MAFRRLCGLYDFQYFQWIMPYQQLFSAKCSSLLDKHAIWSLWTLLRTTDICLYIIYNIVQVSYKCIWYMHVDSLKHSPYTVRHYNSHSVSLIALKKVVLSLIGVASVCHQTSGPFDIALTLRSFVSSFAVNTMQLAIASIWDGCNRLHIAVYIVTYLDDRWWKVLARAVAFLALVSRLQDAQLVTKVPSFPTFFLTTLHALRVIVPCDSVEVLQITPRRFWVTWPSIPSRCLGFSACFLQTICYVRPRAIDQSVSSSCSSKCRCLQLSGVVRSYLLLLYKTICQIIFWGFFLQETPQTSSGLRCLVQRCPVWQFV